MSYIYSAYGLQISTELVLPELTASPDTASSIDITICLGSLQDHDQATDRGSYFLGSVANVGTFLVQQGREIVIDLEPDVDQSVLRAILLGPILCILLRQRKLLVLHASSIAVNGMAVAFMAASGQGKSTLAEAFHTHGYPILTDDVLALQVDLAPPLVLPSYPQIKLWPDAAVSMGHVVEDLPFLHIQTEKRSHRLRQGFASQVLPLKRIYVLDQGATHGIEPMTAQAGFAELVRNSRVIGLLTHPNFQQTHFHQCAQLLQQVSICRLIRFRSLSALPDLIRVLEQDFVSLSTNVHNAEIHNTEIYEDSPVIISGVPPTLCPS